MYACIIIKIDQLTNESVIIYLRVLEDVLDEITL